MFGRSLSAQIFTELMWRHSERPLLLERNGKNNFFHCKIRGIRLSSKKQSSAIGNQPTDDDTYLCKIFWDSHRKREREREISWMSDIQIGKKSIHKKYFIFGVSQRANTTDTHRSKNWFFEKANDFFEKGFFIRPTLSCSNSLSG